MNSRTVASWIMVASVLSGTLLTSSCAKKVFQQKAKVVTSLVAPSDAPVRSLISGYYQPGNRGLLKLVSEQTESTTESRKIVRNGSLDLLVSDVGQAAAKVRAVADRLGGFVEKSSQTSLGGHSAVITLRVPAGSLDRAISEIEGAALNVDRENIEARDVTRDYVDLDARLRNLQAEEQRYLEILKRAMTVKDTLDGTEKISEVRGQIEQLQGEMKYLTAQIDMSSLEISLHADAEAAVLGVRWQPLRQAKVAFGEMISGLADWADSVVAFFINLPLILVWAVTIIALLAIAIRILRFLWQKLWPKTSWRLPWPRRQPPTTAS